MTFPTISVCIPLYRKEAFVAETIKSVLNQTFTDFELVILDNASPDRSGEIARAFDDPRIVVLQNSTTVAPVDNFTKVVAASRGRLVKLLCADDLIQPLCLEREVAAMDENPTAAMVTCRHDMIDEYGQVLAHDRGLRYRDLIGLQDRTAVVRRMVRHGGNPVGGTSNVLFRRAAFEAAGGFPRTDFFALDVSTWVRLLEHGDYLGIPETLACFRINSGSHSSSMGRHALGVQREFVAGLVRENAGVVRLSDRIHGALRAPLTLVRHHLLFAAAGPSGSTARRVATTALGHRHGSPPAAPELQP